MAAVIETADLETTAELVSLACPDGHGSVDVVCGVLPDFPAVELVSDGREQPASDDTENLGDWATHGSSIVAEVYGRPQGAAADFLQQGPWTRVAALEVVPAQGARAVVGRLKAQGRLVLWSAMVLVVVAATVFAFVAHVPQPVPEKPVPARVDDPPKAHPHAPYHDKGERAKR